MSTMDKGAWRRWSERGWPQLAARLILGLVFVWMGLSKTGLIQPMLNAAGLMDDPAFYKAVQGGVVELSNPIDFLKLIREYHIIPPEMPVLLNLTAAVLPWLEVFCGLLLLLGVGQRGVALMFALLMIFFTVMVTARAVEIYQSSSIAFCDIKFDCGCGAGEVYICRKIPENLVLLILSMYLLFSRSSAWCLRRNLVPASAAG